MLAARVIPCLDVKDGRVVKGKKFKDLQEKGDPIAYARRYYSEGADELCLLDISATLEGRKTFASLVRAISREIFIPLTVGGGISEIDDISLLLRAGADKVCIGTAAVEDPKLIGEAAKRFGSQCIMVSVDAKRCEGSYLVSKLSGTQYTQIDAVTFACRMEEIGCGEILLNSIDRDGMREGYDLDLIRRISEKIRIPLIASSGAGSFRDLKLALDAGADAVLAASLFHEGGSILEAKKYLRSKGIEVRI